MMLIKEDSAHRRHLGPQVIGGPIPGLTQEVQDLEAYQKQEADPAHTQDTLDLVDLLVEIAGGAQREDEADLESGIMIDIMYIMSAEGPDTEIGGATLTGTAGIRTEDLITEEAAIQDLPLL